jgi:hypothetical protein
MPGEYSIQNSFFTSLHAKVKMLSRTVGDSFLFLEIGAVHGRSGRAAVQCSVIEKRGYS